MKSYWFLLAVSIVLPASSPAIADNDPTFDLPCASRPYTDFDFWVGEWVAFDYDTGVVQGIDRIEHAVGGCVILQEWSQLTDRYRPAGAPFRYAGMSFSSVLSDGSWQQVWVGNSAGTISLNGQLDAEIGGMVLQQTAVSSTGAEFRRLWYWVPEADNTLHSWGTISFRTASGDWSEPRTEWNLRYVRRAHVGTLIESPE